MGYILEKCTYGFMMFLVNQYLSLSAKICINMCLFSYICTGLPKISQNFPRCWKLLGWIIYLFLMACSVWCTWGVLEKFSKQEIAIRQYEEKIEAHPSIAICNFNPSFWKLYGSGWFYSIYVCYCLVQVQMIYFNSWDKKCITNLITIK